jgi:hypothetical protein
MIILIKNVPFETNNEDVVDFINSARIPLSIEEIVVFSKPSVDVSPLERLVLIWALPRLAVARVIQKLNGSLFKGQCVELREYMIRSVNNDPRKNNPNLAINVNEQRKADRRLKPLIIPWQINGCQ